MAKVDQSDIEKLSKHVKLSTLKAFNNDKGFDNISKKVSDIYLAIKDKDKELNIDEAIIALNKKEFEELEILLSPYHLLTPRKKKETYYAYSLTNIDHKYTTNLVMTSLIGMLFRYVDEKENDNDMSQEQWDAQKKARREFLIEFFKYNPDFHIKSAYHENPNDPTRESLTQLNGKQKNEAIYNVLPPQDLFYKLDKYIHSNYESLREAVNTIYPEKPELEDAIIIYDTFDNIEAAEKFVEKYQNKVTTRINLTKENYWSFTGPFEKNRKVLKLYGDEGTHIFRTMMERREADEKIASDLVSNRIKVSRRRNKKKMGPDHPNWKKYREENPNAFDELGIIEAKERDGEVNKEEPKTDDKTVQQESFENIGYHVDKDTTDDSDLPGDAIRVDIKEINAITGKVDEYVMYSKEVINEEVKV